MTQAANTTMLMATGPLYRLRCTAADIEARPQLYAEVLAREPALRALVADFVQSWRTASGAIAMFALMARRSAPLTFDAVAFLRLVGRDVGQNPGVWAGLVSAQPAFADDCARLTRSLSKALQTNTPTAYA